MSNITDIKTETAAILAIPELKQIVEAEEERAKLVERLVKARQTYTNANAEASGRSERQKGTPNDLQP